MYRNLCKIKLKVAQSNLLYMNAMSKQHRDVADNKEQKSL